MLASAAASRLAGAVAASLGLHGAVLVGLDTLPRHWSHGVQLATGHGAKRSLSVNFQAIAPPAPATRAVAAPAPAQLAAAAPLGGAAPPVAGLLPRPRYYTALELDRRPQPITNIEPNFPVLALSPTGRVTLALYIGATGEIENLEVEAADMTGDFATEARKAFGGARFLPGMKDGVAVRSLMRIEVRFGEPLPQGPATAESVPRDKFVPQVRVRRAR